MKLKTSLLSALFIGLFFVGLTFFTPNTFADQLNQCPTSNPAGTMDCLPGQHYVGGFCVADIVSQPIAAACVANTNPPDTVDAPSTNETYSCAGNNCKCVSGFRDCRTQGVGEYKQCLDPTQEGTIDAAGAAICTAAGRPFNPCKVVVSESDCIQTCLDDFEPVDGACVTLQSVHERVVTLEELELCHFNSSGQYVQEDDVTLCTQPYDPGSLPTKVSHLQEQVDVIFELLMAIIFPTNITDAIDDILTSDPASLSSKIIALHNLITGDISVKFAENGGGSAAEFVGLTTLSYDGNAFGSADTYAKASAECFNNYTDSRVCYPAEIIHSYNIDVFALGAPQSSNKVAWINAGSPANINPSVNDCGGWTKAANPYYGTVWSFANDTAGILPCFASNQFACCK